MVEEAEELIVKTIDVDEHSWFLVQAEILPGENLKHLFKRAEAARQNEEGIRKLGHLRFARVHICGDVQLGDSAVSDLEIDEDLRDDAYDSPLAGETGLGDCFHEAHIGSAIDDTNVLLRKGSTERDGGFKV